MDLVIQIWQHLEVEIKYLLNFSQELVALGCLFGGFSNFCEYV